MTTTPQKDLSAAQIRSRNPLLLNAAQEAEVRDLYHKRVRGYCAAEMRGVKLPFSLLNWH